MIEQRVNRLPVVERDRLVGMVTRADIVKTYLRPDAELVEAIRHDVLVEALWLDAAELSLRVVDGVVEVTGKVERRSTADLLHELVRRTPGVVGVTFAIRWDLDDRGLHTEPAEYLPALGVH